MDIAKVIKGLEQFRTDLKPFCGNHADWERFDAALAMLKEQETMMQCIKGKCRICPHCANCDVDENGLLKEQELPTELKQKMWNALYAEEDEYEKKFVGKEEHLNWFTVYRPWLQKGFDIAINAIANWEGR